ncbi:MAG: hypothetical protein II565_04865, partial [Fibrobacter sp.]|nr:hypothetical protein [Fibrobacter sp.]
MAKKEKKTEKTKKTAKKGFTVKGFKVSESALKEFKKFIASVDTAQKLADFFNQGNDLKKASKISLPDYREYRQDALSAALHSSSMSAFERMYIICSDVIRWADVGPNDKNPHPDRYKVP